MMVFITNGKKLHVSAYSGHLQGLTTFLLKEFYIICLNCVVMLRSHHHFIFIVVFLTEFTSPYSLNTQQRWHTSELFPELGPLRADMSEEHNVNIKWC